MSSFGPDPASGAELALLDEAAARLIGGIERSIPLAEVIAEPGVRSSASARQLRRGLLGSALDVDTGAAYLDAFVVRRLDCDADLRRAIGQARELASALEQLASDTRVRIVRRTHGSRRALAAASTARALQRDFRFGDPERHSVLDTLRAAARLDA